MNAKDLAHRFEALFNASNAEELAALYEPGALVIFAPGQEARGVQQIRAAYERIFASKPKIQLTPVATMEVDSGLALSHSAWTITGTGPDGTPFQYEGKSAEILRRQPDGTRLYAIDNTRV